MVQRALKREKFTEYPSGASIREICKRFSDSGSIENRPRSGRPPKYEENEKSQITAILEEKPTSTLAEISAKVNMDRMTVSRFIHSEMGAKSYKIQIHQYLYDEDFDRRVDTAESLLPYLNNPSMENLIFFLTKPLFIYPVMFIRKIVEYGVQLSQIWFMNLSIIVRK